MRAFLLSIRLLQRPFIMFLRCIARAEKNLKQLLVFRDPIPPSA